MWSSALDVAARTRLLSTAAFGVVVGVPTALLVQWQMGLLLAWMAASGLFIVWVWATIWPMDAAATAAHANREDAGRTATDVVVIAAAVASLGAVGLLLLGGSNASASTKDVNAALCLASVGLAWATLHTLFTIRYGRIYYGDTPGGVDFNQKIPPRYRDFAYLAFTVGMTFQVSDTDITTEAMRANTLRHALFSYLFGAVIIATVINLIAGLSR